MVKPKIIPILNKGRSKFSYGEDSWETIVKHVFRHHILFSINARQRQLYGSMLYQLYKTNIINP